MADKNDDRTRGMDRLVESLSAKLGTLESVLGSIFEGVVVVDGDGKFRFFNAVAEQILGIGLLELQPSDWTAAYGFYLPDRETPYPPDQLPLARALRGEAVDDEEIFVRNPQRPSGIWISASSRPLRDGRALLQGGIVVFHDITARKQERQTIELLSSAVEQTADSVVITDRNGVITYVNPAVTEVSGYGRDELVGQTPRIFKSGRQNEDYYRKLWATIVGGSSHRGVLANRKKNGELYWIQQSITPLKDKSGKITHFVSVGKDVTEQRKLQEIEIQMQLAREIQQKLYPRPETLPPIRGVDIAGSAFPADLTGGDYYDFIPMADGGLCVAVGDVSGHGFGPALVMAEARAYLRAFTSRESEIQAIFSGVNQVLAGDLEQGRYVTLLLARLEAGARLLIYASAGHTPGYLLNADGKVKHILESTDPPLGMFADRTFSSDRRVDLDAGDLLVFLTDGITDAASADGADFGVERALDVVVRNRHRSARQIVEQVYLSVRAFCGSEPQLDDITCVVCKIEPE